MKDYFAHSTVSYHSGSLSSFRQGHNNKYRFGPWFALIDALWPHVSSIQSLPGLLVQGPSLSPGLDFLQGSLLRQVFLDFSKGTLLQQVFRQLHALLVVPVPPLIRPSEIELFLELTSRSASRVYFHPP